MTQATSSQLRAPSISNPFAAGLQIAAGSYAVTSAFDNRETAGSIVAYDLADLELIVSAVTPNAGGSVPVWVLAALDGGTTNYASPGTTAAAAPPSLVRGTYWAVNASTTVINIEDIRIGPYSSLILIQNNLGVGITISSSVLQRKTLASW